jgi:hypothetical protein
MFVCCECRVLSGRGLCDELITRSEESYRLWCVVLCDLETSRMGAPYIYDISHLRVKWLIMFSTDAPSTDTGLELSTPPIRFTRSTLCSFSAKSPSPSALTLLALLCATLCESPLQDCPFLAVCWFSKALIAFPEPLPSQPVLQLDVSF